MANLYDHLSAPGGPGATGGRPRPSALEEHRDSLYERLELGYERIERGLANGEDVTTWEGFWVALLREYDRVCSELERVL